MKMPDLFLKKLNLFFLFFIFPVSGALGQPGSEGAKDSVIFTIPFEKEEKPAFDSIIFFSETFQSKKIPDSLLKKMRGEKDYWYVDQAPKRKVEKRKERREEKVPAKNWFDQAWFVNLVWVLLVMIFVGILIWFLVSIKIPLFNKNSSLKGDIDEQVSEEDLFSIGYDSEIEKAVKEKNFRLATRLWFLYTLKQLAEKELIRYKHDATNSDYLDQLYKTKYYNDFFGLTRSFEYTWYGNFELEERTYNIVEKDFREFNRQLVK
jgi:hypothetical protein